MTSIGELLQSERIQQGKTLQEVSHALNIKKDYLEDIEKNLYDNIPGAVFIKGFIRNYGNYLGLDGDRLVQQFRDTVEDRTPQPQVRKVTLRVQAKADKAQKVKKQGKWPEILIVAGVVIFLLLIIWILI